MRSVGLRENSFPQKINCPVLITRRLVLRLPHVEDIEALVNLADNKHIIARFDKMPSPFTRADAEEFVSRAEKGQIGYYVYTVTRADTGEFIGCCGIGAYKGGVWTDASLPAQLMAQTSGRLSESLKNLRHNNPHNVQDNMEQAVTAHEDKSGEDKNLAETEVFLWLGQPYWGRGYGTEVATALVDAAFRATELEALYARAQDNNAAARKILQKCGFSLLHKGGHLAEGADTVQAIAHYGLSRDSWLDLRRSSPKQAI